MEEVKKYILDGYRFESEAAYEQAKEELSRVNEIKENTDFTDEIELRRVYDSLVEGGIFKSPIGIGFLREIQRKLVKNKEQRKTMKAIPAYKAFEAGEDGSGTYTDKIRILESVYKKRFRNMAIITVFSVIIVITLFMITVFDKVVAPELEIQRITDEYASWKEELSDKEKELNLRERRIEEREAALKDEVSVQTDKPSNETINGINGEDDGESQDSGG